MSRMKKRTLRLLAWMLAALTVLQLAGPVAPGGAQAASSSEIKEQIEELEEENRQLEAEIQALESQIDDNMGQMERLVAQKNIIDQEIFLLNEQMANINQRIQAYNLLIADKQDELDAAQERLQTLTEQNKARIRAMEMYGEMGYWSVLAQAGTFGELLDRLSMVAEISRADQRRLEEMSQAAEQVAQAKSVLETEKAGMEKLRQELEKTQGQMEEKRSQADEVLARLYATGEEYEKYLEQMEDQQNDLLEQIVQAEKDFDDAKRQEYLDWLATSVPPSTESGQDDSPAHVVDGITWVMPINYVRFTSAYGWRNHPIEGIRKFHHGVDLAAPEGTPIYASRSGVVTVATWSDSAGWYVNINHGDGFSTVYMHMTHFVVEEGQYVSAGQKIGECGNTGASKGNHLHFGVYYNGKSQNPAKYINFY